VFAELLDLLAIAVFLVVGGHRHVLAALLDSFQSRPLGNLDLPSGLAAALSSLVGESFAIGLRAGAPVIISLLMAMLILGLISRTLPQLNVLVVGFSLNALILLAVLAISLGSIVGVVVWHADSVIETVHRALVSN
jgi:flagellar biosynthetic protein FliR